MRVCEHDSSFSYFDGSRVRYLKTERKFQQKHHGINNLTDWENIIYNEYLFKDSFDEVPLNLHMLNNKLKMVFIENGIAVHPSYNTINIYGHNYKNLSDSFFNGI